MNLVSAIAVLVLLHNKESNGLIADFNFYRHVSCICGNCLKSDPMKIIKYVIKKLTLSMLKHLLFRILDAVRFNLIPGY